MNDEEKLAAARKNLEVSQTAIDEPWLTEEQKLKAAEECAHYRKEVNKIKNRIRDTKKKVRNAAS